jgi:hypothetical protein
MTRSRRASGEIRSTRDRLPEEARSRASKVQMTLDDGIRQDGLYDKLVFIVGNARSGTTIVANILNLSEKFYLMEEANLFIHLTKPDFPQWFNATHRDLGHAPRKGRYVPPFQGDGETGLVTLQRLARDYDFVGDKVAFVPGETFDGRSQQQYFFEEHAKFFGGCRYILTMRNPHESLLSMHRMFPATPLPGLLWCWLESLRYGCFCFTSFKRCRMIFSESVGPDPFAAIGDFMGLELAVPKEYFSDRSRQTSAAAAFDFGREHNAEIGTALGGCDVIYRDLRNMFSPETLRYRAPAQPFELIGATIERIEALQDRLGEESVASHASTPAH